MGNKKKRNHPDLEELLQRPWCYYCERDFDDLKILLDHQRAKHFKCERCGRRLNTAGGLNVHMNQVHKETLSCIDNALPNRSGLDVEIFGDLGIPADVAEQHRLRVISQYSQAEAERRAATGNPPPGAAAAADGTKKVKMETLDDIKKRKAEFKAKKAAEAAAAGEQGNNVSATSPSIENGANSHQMPSTFNHPQPYVPHMQAPGQTFSPSHAGSAFTPPLPGSFGSPYQSPNTYNAMGYGQGFGNGMAPGAYGAGSPPVPFGQTSQFQAPPALHTSPPPGILAPPPGIASPAGLPQRPAFGAPPVNAAAMQQLHQGQIPPQMVSSNGMANGHQASVSATATPVPQTPLPDPTAPSSATPAAKAEGEPAASKKGKKEDKTIRMVYSDNEVSPEEKMSSKARYSFKRSEFETKTTLEHMDAEKVGGLNAPTRDGE